MANQQMPGQPMMQNVNPMQQSFNQSPPRTSNAGDPNELKGQVALYQEKLDKQIKMYESLKKDTEE